MLTALLGLSCLLAGTVLADEGRIRAAITDIVPDADIKSVTGSAFRGFHEVDVGGQLLYVSDDGEFLVQGKVIDLKRGLDLTERTRNRMRADAVAAIPADHRIVFEPEQVKHRVTVFTDIDCGYCRRLHQEIADFHAHGIAIEYLFYPRSGLDTDSYQKAVNVWCAPDRRDAITRAKAGEALETRQCEHPIREDFVVGQGLGLAGTPAVIAADGSQIGYLPADQLAAHLARVDAAATAAARP